MLTLFNKIKNSIHGNFKPDPVIQCDLDSCYNIFMHDTLDRQMIEAMFNNLALYQQALNTIPCGRTFTINTLESGEVKLYKGINGFRKAD